MVQDSDERFEVAAPARLPVAPLLEEGFKALELVGRESELAGDRVHLDAEEGKACRRALALVLREWYAQLGARTVE
jgi:hypothetical protein